MQIYFIFLKFRTTNEEEFIAKWFWKKKTAAQKEETTIGVIYLGTVQSLINFYLIFWVMDQSWMPSSQKKRKEIELWGVQLSSTN